jgi:hypothetical protein
MGPSDLEFEPVVLERAPVENWRGIPLPGNVGLFAFPDGLRASSTPAPPSLSTFVLTFEDGTKLSCGCLVQWSRLDALETLALFAVGVGGGTGVGGGHGGGGGSAPASPTSGDAALRAAPGAPGSAAAAAGGVLALPPWLDAASVGEAGWADAHPIFVPTATLLVSRAPLFTVLRATLCQLARLASARGAAPAALERLIPHLLLDVPMPPRGGISIGFTLGDRHVVAARPAPNALPLLDVPLAPLFQCLDASHLLIAFSALLCERRVCLVSRHGGALLTPVAEALTALLFPFKWVVNYIPVLPAAMAEILGAPTPYLIGWAGRVADAQSYSAETIFVDLDRNALHIPSYAPLPKLPEQQKKKLLRALRDHA